jgi:hypothetical protein
VRGRTFGACAVGRSVCRSLRWFLTLSPRTTHGRRFLCSFLNSEQGVLNLEYFTVEFDPELTGVQGRQVLLL